jgi:hypothetical protein
VAQVDYWKHISGVLVLFQTCALLVSVYFVHVQLRYLENTKESRSADLIFRFDERLSRDPFLKLRYAIENDKPILKAHGGKFTNDDLEGFLDIFDSLNDVYAKDLISKDMFYNSYSYDIQKTYDNDEVQTHLKEIRKEDPGFYSGFESLAKQMKARRPLATSSPVAAQNLH